mmetsp:Transcript_26807/g.34804  ORF Transcript_26807/g.34804 Transcript_26807/m.34804 type:complete len:344 (+) Transcript_26807:58-1089(+)
MFNFGSGTQSTGAFSQPMNNAMGTGAAGGLGGGFNTTMGGVGSQMGGSMLGNLNQPSTTNQNMQNYAQGPMTNDDRKYDEHLASLQSLISSYTSQSVPPSNGLMNALNQTPTMSDSSSFRSLIYTESQRTSGVLVPFPSRPQQTSSEQWRKSVNRLVEHDLTDQLHPKVCVGGATLANYTESISNKANELKEMINVSRNISRKRDESTRMNKERMERIRKKHEMLTLKLLEVMVKLHVVKNMETPIQSAERDLYQKFAFLQEKTRVSTTMVHDLRAEVSITNGQQGSSGSSGGGGGYKLQVLESHDEMVLKQSLKHQRLGLDKLCSVLLKDQRDLEIIRKMNM